MPKHPTASGAMPSLRGSALWLSFAAATTGTLMVNIDATAVNVALPVMQREFALPIAALQWVVTSYLLVITGVLPLTGQVADLVGRKRLFVLGIGAFTLGSVLAALSSGFLPLVGARMLQGIGGAIIQANVMAIVVLTFPIEGRGKALGMIGSVVAAGTLAGPPIGGLLTALYGWPSIFWVNLPIGVWGIWASWRYLPAFPRDHGLSLRRLDWFGAGLFLAATTLLQFGLSNLHQVVGLWLLLLTALAMAVFIRHERSAARPVMPLRLFAIAPFWRNMVAGMAYWLLMMAPSLLMPFYLRLVLREPIAVVGLSLIPQALGMIVVSPFGGQLVDRLGVLLPGRVGLALFMVSDAALALLPANPPLWAVMLILLAIGTASGLYNAPNNTAVLNSVPAKDTGLASSLLAVQRNLGRSVGVAVASIELSIFWILAGIGPAPSHTSASYPAVFLLGFRGVFWSGLLFGAIGILMMQAPQRPEEEQRAEAAAARS
ncbi:MAG: MFS transporter [Thermaerobacter sp.]|nr:MFS transporter [Thermaerobacter sp.]